MIGILKGWVDEKLYNMYLEVSKEKREIEEKYKELQKDYDELINDYGKRVEEVNELKTNEILKENPEYAEEIKKG